MFDHSLGVGKDLHTHCTKCAGDRWHVVVAKVDGKIKRVECKICGSLHNLKVHLEKAAPHKRGSESPSRRKMVTSSSVPGKPWQQLVMDREVAGEGKQGYNLSSGYSMGNLIDHPKFGLGVVVKILDNQRRAEVAFEDGMKVLAIGRV